MNSTEHNKTADDAEMTIGGYQTTGKEFKFHHEKSDSYLTYGVIVSLAGDYYATFEKFEDAGRDELAKLLNSDVYLKDAAVDFELLGSHPITGINYYLLALKNPQHFRGCPWPSFDGHYKPFEQDDESRTTYAQGHSFAVQAYKQAQNSKEQSRAYAINAFYDHFLTDMFSAGHMRVPRRALHGVFFPRSILSAGLTLVAPIGGSAMAAWESVPIVLDYPTSRQMHDEDGKVGLWVRHSWFEQDLSLKTKLVKQSPRSSIDDELRNEPPWKAYGDGSQQEVDNQKNWKKCLEAVRLSVKAVTSGEDLFEAFKLVPEVFPPGADIYENSRIDDYECTISPLDEFVPVECYKVPFPSSKNGLIIPAYLADRYYRESRGAVKALAERFLYSYSVVRLKDKRVWEFRSIPNKDKNFGRPLGKQSFPMYAYGSNRLLVRIGSDPKRVNRYVTAEFSNDDASAFDKVESPNPHTIRMPRSLEQEQGQLPKL